MVAGSSAAAAAVGRKGASLAAVALTLAISATQMVAIHAASLADPLLYLDPVGKQVLLFPPGPYKSFYPPDPYWPPGPYKSFPPGPYKSAALSLGNYKPLSGAVAANGLQALLIGSLDEFKTTQLLKVTMDSDGSPHAFSEVAFFYISNPTSVRAVAGGYLVTGEPGSGAGLSVGAVFVGYDGSVVPLPAPAAPSGGAVERVMLASDACGGGLVVVQSANYQWSYAVSWGADAATSSDTGRPRFSFVGSSYTGAVRALACAGPFVAFLGKSLSSQVTVTPLSAAGAFGKPLQHLLSDASPDATKGAFFDALGAPRDGSGVLYVSASDGASYIVFLEGGASKLKSMEKFIQPLDLSKYDEKVSVVPGVGFMAYLMRLGQLGEASCDACSLVKTAGWLQAAESGGQVAEEPVSEDTLGDFIYRKHVTPVQYDDIVLHDGDYVYSNIWTAVTSWH
eukprot:jgi/Mesen1/1318/ME000013S00816